MKQKTYLDTLMENDKFKERFNEEYQNLQTNENREEKNVVEVWEWKDAPWQYSPGIKRLYRRLRRKRLKRLLNREIQEVD